ncbi:MAG: short-chain dehydrogenase [Nitrospirales bacterium]|nr:MAG: short-chain dehydrogenase [Nitrospirales bacterium]
MKDTTTYHGTALWSYGFRPFFLLTALFAGLAIPAWALILSSATDIEFFYPSRDWHVHEMVFGFLPCVITGFLLTAIPNWTDRPPITGLLLMLLVAVWLLGRIAISTPWLPPFLAVMTDTAFLILVAGIVWVEIVTAHAWNRLPIGIIISLYASANILFHVLALRQTDTDLAARMALALMMMLLTLIGGRITPSFTEDFFDQHGSSNRPAAFSYVDRVSIALVGIAALAWIITPESLGTGTALVLAGLANGIRLVRWQGWGTWPEPLVSILHIGYAWLAISLLTLGVSTLGIGLLIEDALHALTTGAIGVMTLAVMSRASLGHTGRPKQANAVTVLIYLLVNLGAILRVFGPSLHVPEPLLFTVAAACWSGAYAVFAIAYGPILLKPSLDET